MYKIIPDVICKMDDDNHRNIIVPAQGSHIVLPDFYSPANMGLIVPKTKDGRVVFMLPWLGHTIAGTTDEQVEVGSLIPLGGGGGVGPSSILFISSFL
jgi:glycerol-3-phosphate dehydrogenase